MDKLLSYVMIFCFLLSSTAFAMGQAPNGTVKDSSVGGGAPDVVLSKTDGSSSDIIGSNKGKKIVLIFWATWCPHCYEELGSINQNIASVEAKGIKIVLVDVGESVGQVQSYFRHRQMNLVSFVDENSFLMDAYHLIGVPTLVFIDENGHIRNVTHTFPSDYENYFHP